MRKLITVVGEVVEDHRPPVVEARRPGDAPRAVASAQRAAGALGRRARRGGRKTVESA